MFSNQQFLFLTSYFCILYSAFCILYSQTKAFFEDSIYGFLIDTLVNWHIGTLFFIFAAK
jgi:hypothetical protein